MRMLVTFLWLSAVAIQCAETRLVPAAGPNSTTLVLYSEKRAPFSLGNNLELLHALLRQFDTRIETLSLKEAPDVLSADYVVVFCPQSPLAVPKQFKERIRPTIWIGQVAETMPATAKVVESLYDTPALNDALAEFYKVKLAGRSRLLVRLEDYGCESDHRQFRRVADFLLFRGVPFAVGVLNCDLDAHDEFVRSLKYAQQRGARLVLRTHFKFWDADLDRPLNSDAVSQLETMISAFRRHGLSLVAWENAGPSPPRALEPLLAKSFPLRIGAVRLSDATARDQFVAHRILPDAHGGTIVPDTFGYLAPGGATNGFEEVRSAARGFLAARSGAGSFVFHTYLPFSTIAAGMEELRSWNVDFLDLAELRE